MNYRVANRILLVLIIILNGYVIIAPFLPQVSYGVEKVFSEPVQVETPEERDRIDTSFDHVIIPEIGLDQKVWFGDDPWLVNKGVWHIPHSSTPDKGSNTVLVGHRFTYKDPAVFYHLDKLEKGDQIVFVYEGKKYVYKVNDKQVVYPDAVHVEEPSDDSRLTLYTCTPLWSTKQRLVITASLEAVDE